MKRAVLLLQLLLFMLAAGPAGARVFWGFGRSDDGLINATDPGFRKAYEADLIINGGRAKATVWGTPRTPGEVLNELRDKAQRAGTHAAFASGGALAWGIIVMPDERVERVLVSAAEGRYSHVFQIVQPGGEYLKSLSPPDRIPFDAPEPGEGRLLSAFANETAGGAVATIECRAPPLAVRSAYAQQLAAAGWTRAPAGGGDAALFLRDGALLLVTVKRSGGDDGALVTLVHKRLKSGGRP